MGGGASFVLGWVVLVLGTREDWNCDCDWDRHWERRGDEKRRVGRLDSVGAAQDRIRIRIRDLQSHVTIVLPAILSYEHERIYLVGSLGRSALPL